MRFKLQNFQTKKLVNTIRTLDAVHRRGNRWTVGRCQLFHIYRSPIFVAAAFDDDGAPPWVEVDQPVEQSFAVISRVSLLTGATDAPRTSKRAIIAPEPSRVSLGSGAVRVAPRTMASRRDPARDSRWVSAPRTVASAGIADSLSQGVHPQGADGDEACDGASRLHLVPEETPKDGAPSRLPRAGPPRAHVSRVLAEANAEAFEKLEAFVKARFAGA